MKSEAAIAWAQSERGRESARKTRERMGSRTKYNRQWREANREADLQRKRDWYNQNKDRSRATTDAWKDANPARVASHDTKKRLRKEENFIEDVNRNTVYEMHGGMCGICLQFVSQDNFHVDHIVPLSRGGAHGYVNVQPAHLFCNQSKHAKLMEELHG